MGLKERRWRLT